MFKKTVWIAILITAAAVAQDKPNPAPGPTLRLEYTVVEMEGAKKTSSRTYTMMLEGGKTGRMRTGTRVPFSSGKDQAMQYMDVGTNFDARTTMTEGAVRVITIFEISSVTAAEGPSATRAPVLRSCSDNVETVVPLDKQVVLTTQDDPGNNTSLQVLLVIKLVK